MSSTSPQLQGSAADRQGCLAESAHSVSSPGNNSGPEPSPDTAPARQYVGREARAGMAPAAQLSIASWYAISGTAMA